MKTLTKFLLATASCTPLLAMSASFDCRQAGNGTTEAAICADAALSKLDAQLAHSYRGALKAVEPSSKKALVQEQKNWVTYVRNVCADAACLREAYQSRIALLTQNAALLVNPARCDAPADGSACQSVVRYRDPSVRIASFNDSLTQSKQAGKIVGCAQLIDLPTGTAHGNHSFGGTCTLQNRNGRSRVRICNDDMIGHFAIEATTENDSSEKALIDFTRAQCFGG